MPPRSRRAGDGGSNEFTKEQEKQLQEEKRLISCISNAYMRF